MYLRLYPKYTNNSYDVGTIKKLDYEIKKLEDKINSTVSAYEENFVFEDYYYVTNEKYKNQLSFPYKECNINKVEKVIMSELPKGKDTFVYLEFILNDIEYKGFMNIANYMVWSNNLTYDNTVKFTVEDYVYKSITMVSKPNKIDYINGEIVTIYYYELENVSDPYTNGHHYISMSIDVLKKNFYDARNLHFREEDLATGFYCDNRVGKKISCTTHDGGTSRGPININKSDDNYNYYKNSNEWKIESGRQNQIVYGSDEVGDEITTPFVGLDVIIKDSSSHQISVIDYDGIIFYYKRDKEDYFDYDSGENISVIQEKIDFLKKEKESIINREIKTHFDFPIDNEYKFSIDDSIEIGEEIKESVNNLAFGMPNKLVGIDDTLRSLNFREQDAFHQFGTPTLRTQTTKSDIKIKPITGTIDTSTIAGIMDFLRLLYISSPKINGEADNVFMNFTENDEAKIIEYLTSIQNVINSKRGITKDILTDNFYGENNSLFSVANILGGYGADIAAKATNYLSSSVSSLIGSDDKTTEERHYKGNNGIGYTADYVDFALYELCEDHEYFLFDSRNTYDHNTPLDVLLNNNDKFASVAVPVLIGNAIGGTPGKVVAGVGAAAGIASSLYKYVNEDSVEESEKNKEANFVIKDMKITFSPTSGLVKEGFTFPTYVKYTIDMDTKKAPLLNDVIRMSLLHQMIVSEKQKDIVAEENKTLSENVDAIEKKIENTDLSI